MSEITRPVPAAETLSSKANFRMTESHPQHLFQLLFVGRHFFPASVLDSDGWKQLMATLHCTKESPITETYLSEIIKFGNVEIKGKHPPKLWKMLNMRRRTIGNNISLKEGYKISEYSVVSAS